MEIALPVILQYVIGIEVKESEQLTDDLQHTKERKTDVLRRVTDSEGNRFILHIEYQVANEPQMALRMAEYCIMALRKYRLPVQQHVIFLGKGRATMPTAIEEKNFWFRYNLINIRDIDYRFFLRAAHPEQKIFAILGNFENESPELALRHIVQEVKQSASGLELGRYFRQLRILAQLRNLDLDFLNDMESITSFFRNEKDILYIWGKKEGQEESKEAFVRNLLQNTDFSPEKIAMLADVSETFVRDIQAGKKEN